jgi:predicted enzyme related to lactoylglutathione lyase
MVVPDLEAEAERVVRLGARRVRPTFEEAGDLIAVLADPEGNEFCLVQQLEGAREA